MEIDRAIALSYTDALEAPLVLASGKGLLAERMLEIARDCGIPVVADPDLSAILSSAEIGSCIPAESWEAAAAIFAFLEKGCERGWFK
jgi:Uncharacterized homolog of the cytoplasmic domain of flagellar protein FhlB